MIVSIVCDYMSQIVRIEVRLPNGHWAGEVTRNHSNLVLQIIETMPLGKRAEELHKSLQNKNYFLIWIT